jgi:hypothetical protein
MYGFARNDGIDPDELRPRPRKMTDDDLLRFGKAARFMCRDTIATAGVRDSVGGSESGMVTTTIRSVRGNPLQVRRSNLTGSIDEEPPKQREHEKNQNHVGLLFRGHWQLPRLSGCRVTPL